LRLLIERALGALASLAACAAACAQAALPGCDATLPDAASQTFTNPVVDANYPDPFVLRTGDGFVAYATNGHGKNVPTLRSRDLVTWQPGEDALPELPAWAREGFTWAPEVLAAGGRYLLYFTARVRQSGNLQCIGVAVAERPEGPFRSLASQPLVCQPDEGGSIDPSPFRAPDGELYLYWKSDGNAIGRPTWLQGQPLSADGLSLTGAPTRLLRNDAAWEGAVIEAPTVVHERGRYLLLFSANHFGSRHYAIGYATGPSPLGSFAKAPENPIVSTSGGAFGPGHQSLVQDDAGQNWLLYHAWRDDPPAGPVAARTLWLDRLEMRGDGTMAVNAPGRAAQRKPRVCPAVRGVMPCVMGRPGLSDTPDGSGHPCSSRQPAPRLGSP
jgi:beta-xylosidase